jgi:hypothetical protein
MRGATDAIARPKNRTNAVSGGAPIVGPISPAILI